MNALFVFGLGYTGARLAARQRAAGWHVIGTGRAGIAFDDEARVRAGLATASHVVSTIPPSAGGDPVLVRYRDALPGRIGYLSSTGVYGDSGGGWVDETAPCRGRRPERNAADAAWLAIGARVYRLPGIYGPGRSALDRVASGRAYRVDVDGQVFSRIHVDDLVAGILAGLDGPPGAYNLADDAPASQNAVIERAAAMLGVPPPPYVELATLSAMSRAFYAENRRVANGKAKRVLGWQPRHPDYRAGLIACVEKNVEPASELR